MAQIFNYQVLRKKGELETPRRKASVFSWWTHAQAASSTAHSWNGWQNIANAEWKLLAHYLHLRKSGECWWMLIGKCEILFGIVSDAETRTYVLCTSHPVAVISSFSVLLSVMWNFPSQWSRGSNLFLRIYRDPLHFPTMLSSDPNPADQTVRSCNYLKRSVEDLYGSGSQCLVAPPFHNTISLERRETMP